MAVLPPILEENVSGNDKAGGTSTVSSKELIVLNEKNKLASLTLGLPSSSVGDLTVLPRQMIILMYLIET